MDRALEKRGGWQLLAAGPPVATSKAVQMFLRDDGSGAAMALRPRLRSGTAVATAAPLDIETEDEACFQLRWLRPIS